MLEKIVYTTKAQAKGGRTGRVHSEDGAVDLPLVMPKAMGGPGEVGANPETLFACGYAACFESACRAVAQKSGLKAGPETSVTAEVSIGPRKEGGFQLAVTLSVHLDGLDKAQAEKVAMSAHNDMCPYSHATRGNVDVKIEVV
ncbi:MAG: Peroxiredoxin, Ohr subfamily [Candidatus Tokpelaia hoelldobleri]|uniref:Peroxiredoxin, Ohr subfamily n=1 Tax=Candidatus Tokpelaia hoelldobleri TaxID=1902579 RepID=A0A1U9JTN2_9HYPH|nr:MAG: Peroxiredoxin, Ohr subfamily [Candidatus Tokpelaia hoelldoblerii]